MRTSEEVSQFVERAGFRKRVAFTPPLRKPPARCKLKAVRLTGGVSAGQAAAGRLSAAAGRFSTQARRAAACSPLALFSGKLAFRTGRPLRDARGAPLDA